jgi:hypothetical protein
LEVWAALTVDVLLPLLYKNGGLIHKDRDLLWRPDNEIRCRALLRRPVQEAVAAHYVGPDLYFLFPLLNAEFQDVLRNAYPVTALVFEVFLQRLESYTVPLNQSAAFPAGTTLEERLLDTGSFLLAANLTRELYPPDVALKYETIRMERERILYWNRWAPFLAPGVGEIPLIGLLQYNHGLWHWLKDRIVTPTAEDEQAWWRVHGAGEMPVTWFALHCAQVGGNALRDFPIYPGGLIHMPAHASWIASWIWDGLVVPDAQRRFAAPPIPKQSSMLHRLGILAEAKSLATCAKMPLGYHHCKQRMTAMEPAIPAVDDGGGVDIEEMGNLWSVLPPCLRRMRELGRFPINEERRFAVEIMRLGGLSLETMLDFFEHLNNRYPKPQPETLKKRFQVEATLHAWKAKSDHEQQIWCTTLINNALDQGANGGCLVCPYALQRTPPPAPGQDRSLFAGQCRETCVIQSGCAGPRRKPHWKPWATPSSALQEALEKPRTDACQDEEEDEEDE